MKVGIIPRGYEVAETILSEYERRFDTPSPYKVEWNSPLGEDLLDFESLS